VPYKKNPAACGGGELLDLNVFNHFGDVMNMARSLTPLKNCNQTDGGEEYGHCKLEGTR